MIDMTANHRFEGEAMGSASLLTSSHLNRDVRNP